MSRPTPAWPSLYDPLVEFRHFEHRDPIQPRGHYLSNAGDIFRFTFFWMLVFHAPMFLASGALAFFNIIYPPRRARHVADLNPDIRIPMSALPHPHPASPSPPQSPVLSPSPYAALLPRYGKPHAPTDAGAGAASKRGKNVVRSRATFAVLTLFAFFLAIVASSLLQSLVLGYILAGVYAAAKYNMSTWVPFVWALVVTASGALGIFPSVMDRI
ncbi:hypothetical protein OF83DRAFT_1153300 [Amylostereum chailletii]|nr:hypothetical protein OF83DRAFT_1153300 [Amylostereum chailletii]